MYENENKKNLYAKIQDQVTLYQIIGHFFTYFTPIFTNSLLSENAHWKNTT